MKRFAAERVQEKGGNKSTLNTLGLSQNRTENIQGQCRWERDRQFKEAEPLILKSRALLVAAKHKPEQMLQISLGSEHVLPRAGFTLRNGRERSFLLGDEAPSDWLEVLFCSAAQISLFFSERLSATVWFTRFIKDTPESHLMKVSEAPFENRR